MKTLISIAVLAMASTAHAAFIVDDDIAQSTEIHASLDGVSKKAPALSDLGTITHLNDLTVTFSAPAAVIHDAIVPVDDALTSVTFTPKNDRAFGDFSFVSQQLTDGETLTLTVLGAHGSSSTFTVPTGPASENLHRFGVEAIHGDTIKSVTITDAAGFRDLKNPEFSFAAAVPEPASWAMMLVGVGMAGATMRRRRAVLAV